MSSSSPNDSIQETSSKTEVKLKGLPDGWRREVVIRKNGQSAGKTDVYYYSPCGKKFRSKPQIARFLGDSADLSVFDFSRGALSSTSGVSHRRARDRHVRRPFDGKGSPALIKPLSSHPLGASGPIRRTCGVIKLPVIWVPEPKEKDESMLVSNGDPEPEPMDTSDSPSPLPAPCRASSETNGSVSPLPSAENQVEEKPKTPDQSLLKSSGSPSPIPQAPMTSEGNKSTPNSQSPAPSSCASSSPFSAPISSTSTSTTSSQHVFPALWENRLRGYVVHNHETKTEIKVDLERLHNGVTQPVNGALREKGSSHGGLKMENGTTTCSGDSKLSGSGIQLPQTTLLNNLLGKQNIMTSTTSSVQSGGTSIVPSLLAHGAKASHKQMGGASAGGVLSQSGKFSKDSGSQLKPGISSSSAPQAIRNNITSGNIVLAVPTITQGAIKMIKEAAAESSRADMKQASTVLGQKQSLKTGPVISSVSSHGTNDGKQNLFVSKSELVLQEEKVRRLREQLLAAQGTA